jgi:hypothetical protein
MQLASQLTASQFAFEKRLKDTITQLGYSRFKIWEMEKKMMLSSDPTKLARQLLNSSYVVATWAHEILNVFNCLPVQIAWSGPQKECFQYIPVNVTWTDNRKFRGF